jgi:HSP20 family protein
MTTVVRWQPRRESSSLQREMNRLFNTVFEAPGAGAARRWVPAMDLVEAEDAFVLTADLPGLAQEDVKIELEESRLTISGERRTQHETREGGFHRIERASGTFSRSLTLPKGVDGEAVTAAFANGVLEVRIPKPEVAKPRRIEIAVGEASQPTIEGSESA